MTWLKGVKGSMVNLDRIMCIVTAFNAQTEKYDVKAFYDSIHCNDLKSFECEEHAIDYVDNIYLQMKRRQWTLEIYNSAPSSFSMEKNIGFSDQQILPQNTVMQTN